VLAKIAGRSAGEPVAMINKPGGPAPRHEMMMGEA